jgi:hypothetical protein
LQEIAVILSKTGKFNRANLIIHQIESVFYGFIQTGLFRTLQDKSNQLKAVASNGYPSVLILDCRSLLPPELRDPSTPDSWNRPQLKAHILFAGKKFLDENRWVSGIVWWWKKAEWPLRTFDMINEPPAISMTIENQYMEVVDSVLAADVFRSK